MGIEVQRLETIATAVDAISSRFPEVGRPTSFFLVVSLVSFRFYCICCCSKCFFGICASRGLKSSLMYSVHHNSSGSGIDPAGATACHGDGIIKSTAYGWRS